MNYETEQGMFGRSVMAGLFAGIIATLGNLVFDLAYRSITRFNPSQIVNVASIIFVSILLSVIAGILYYLVFYYVHKNNVFSVFFIALTVFITFVAFTVQRSSDPRVTSQFQGLFAGIVMITGIINAFLIPYMAKHKNFVF